MSVFLCVHSAAVGKTLHDIKWYKCNVKTRKMILMMLRRSQKPKKIAIPFLKTSMTAFSSQQLYLVKAILSITIGNIPSKKKT
ncbi:hypothetical protein FF38_10162 [Lucilia cuprina]|uniref:Uncharacterized protein n=1 Tax=Lucilia cuprina TaxID=7375 RepID=A0A0L0C9A4_LUCCU|nr:hypothetical protein FF38_10162 [Lucilia cuprina]